MGNKDKCPYCESVYGHDRECPKSRGRFVTDGGRKTCVECDAKLPDEPEPGVGVYCPKCGTGQHV